MFGVIGGTGIYRLMDPEEELRVETPYGTVELGLTHIGKTKVYLLARHGKKHELPPHLVNYRANIWALHSLGVERILSTSAVGSMVPEIRPGELVYVRDVIDLTSGRERTFFDKPVHVDFTDPLCPQINSLLEREYRGVVYVCTNGPRFETPAEIRAYTLLGGEVVGMTLAPEVFLAREKAMCYSSVSIVTNYAAGIKGKKLTIDEVLEVTREKEEEIRTLFSKLISELKGMKRTCPCPKALDGATL